ncbi:hypothetical protein UPYG_G00294660 [Umbra pygmaea]|uniref:Integrin alpha-2 domain-containing protein n=1 Tax=Umbra pygmaea TaxID=75934 RepID=A0ABD0W9J4_UMBPY
MGVRLQLISSLSLIFLLEWTQTSAFNLDTTNVLIKSGDPGSLFGFSLAMHQQLIPSDKRKLLVGAPRDKSIGGQKITGGLYDCDITSSSPACLRVEFDKDENLQIESKDNQWMGVTVKSQGPGGKVVTCAHRYQQRSNVNSEAESRNILGRCYVLSQDLSINEDNDEDGGNWKLCEGRKAGHELYGSCQQGMSVAFTPDPNNYLVFGAPGAFNWKGVVRMENSTLPQLKIYNDGPYEIGLHKPNEVPVPESSYLGFSLDSGNAITKKKHLTVVAGAPRANHSGEVVFLTKTLNTLLTPEHILKGEGLASSFGYDLAVVDLNADGWDDLVVGAPQFFLKDKTVGGAIYVYINNNGDWSKTKYTRIDGDENSMFGLAVENLRDVNLDGYNDIAVGAPYADMGAGKVYIYHGSAQGLVTKPAQVLSGTTKIKMFGYSLAGKMDLDKNSYPDLAVGSLSDTVSFFRARSVISIQTKVETTPKEIDLTKKNCGSSICIDVTACISYTALPVTYNPELRINYTISVEEERLKSNLPSRVVIIMGSKEQDFNMTGVVTLRGQGLDQCVKAKIRLLDKFNDKLRGIPIQVTVGIQNSNRKRRQLPELTPILNPKMSGLGSSTVNFHKSGCGSDNVCQSNLQIQHRFCFNKDPNFPSLPVNDGVPIFQLKDQKDIVLAITVTNKNGDDAHEAKLLADFPSSLTYSTCLSADHQVTCAPSKNGTWANCDLGNPFKRNSNVTFYIILSTARISLNDTELEVDLQLQTTSLQDKIAVKANIKVMIELQLSLTGLATPSQVYFGGEVTGESAMKTEDDIGSLIQFEFRVINLGKSLKTYGDSFLIVNWPKETMDGKYLFYLVAITSEGLGKIMCSPRANINPLHVKEESGKQRTRRAITQTDKSEGVISAFTKTERKSDTLECEDGAKCVDISCPLHDLDRNAVIQLRARLWNSTLIEKYATLNYLHVIVRASLKVDLPSPNIVLKNTETQLRVTVFPERTMAQYGSAPWWPILVAILLGLLLLGLLAFILWKCGFFGKNKDDDSSSEKERLTSSDP